MPYSMSARIQVLSLWLALSSMDDSGSGAQEDNFQLLQPQDTVSVSPGGTLTLTCSVSGTVPVGPVSWFKGSGSGRQLVYKQTGSFPRVTRAVPNNDTDFTIRIHDTHPEDAGVYHCVKFKKGADNDTEIRSGPGTIVSVSDSPSAVTAAVATACVLLVILLLLAVYVYWRKKRGRSLCPARSQAPSLDDLNTRHQPTDQNDILYADLQHSGRPQKPKESTPEEHSEYASIKTTQPSAR